MPKTAVGGITVQLGQIIHTEQLHDILIIRLWVGKPYDDDAWLA